jgi:hypothetical protein
VQVILINLPGYEDGIPDLTETCTLPVLQDTTKDGVANEYGAEKWYIYLIDRDGKIRLIHYSLDLDSERDRLLEEIAELVGEG